MALGLFIQERNEKLDSSFWRSLNSKIVFEHKIIFKFSCAGYNHKGNHLFSAKTPPNLPL